jgi:hypothetical protein
MAGRGGRSKVRKVREGERGGVEVAIEDACSMRPCEVVVRGGLMLNAVLRARGLPCEVPLAGGIQDPRCAMEQDATR